MRVWRDILGGIRRFLAPSPRVFHFLLIGLLVRMLLAPWTSYPYDAYPFYGAVVGSLAGTGPYGNVLFTYPPLFSAISYPSFWTIAQFMDPASFGTFVPSMIDISRATGMTVPFITSPVFNTVLKLPLLIGDALVGLTIYRSVNGRLGGASAEKAFLVWFLNPLVIFVSSVHGQFDVLAAYCALVGVLSFGDRRFLMSGAVLGLGVLLKLFPAYLVISLGLVLLVPIAKGLREGRKAGSLRPLASFLAGGAMSLLTVLPFLISSSSFLEYILRRGTYSSVGGMNIWFISPLLSKIGGEGGSGGGAIPFGTALLVLGFALTIAVTLLVMRKHLVKERLLACSAAVLLVVLLTQSVTNPQHLIWLFPFLVLMSCESPRMLTKVYALTVLGLLYLLCLQSGFMFLYPLAEYVGWPSVSFLNQGVEAFFIGTGLQRAALLSLLGAGGFLTLLSVLLPSRLDYIEVAARRIFGRGDGD
ncbi:MAG: DUF2029 domain-containing protein [Euryarchaeota archaeon]|nr:DUF2029 domain-containing protein [Euryarchaeota archaeon]